MPTISRWQPPRAWDSSATWPGCSRSKQPLVKPTRSPALRQKAARAWAVARSTTLAAPDRDAAGDVGEAGGRHQVAAGGQRHGECRQHAVAGARDVEHLAGLGGQVHRRRAAAHQGHAGLAAGDQDGRQARRLDQPRGRLGDRLVAGIGERRGERQLLPVGGQQGDAGIAREIAALGIGDRRHAGRPRPVDDAAQHGIAQHALGVVGEDHEVGLADARLDRRQDALPGRRAHRPQLLMISPQHLLDAGDEARLRRPAPARCCRRAGDAASTRRHPRRRPRSG